MSALSLRHFLLAPARPPHTPTPFTRVQVTPRYKDFMKFQIQRARDYYALAKRGIPMLAPDARFAVQASLDLYSRILDVVERNDYDNFRKRAYTTKFEKLSILPQSWMGVKEAENAHKAAAAAATAAAATAARP